MKDFEILFVDDKRETLSLVDEYLSYHGYSITIVDSGLKAFELVKERDFDIVLTDLRMPGFSGVELLAARKNPFSKFRSLWLHPGHCCWQLSL